MPGVMGLDIVAQAFTVGGIQVTALLHSPAANDTEISVGQFEITGAVLSVTVTLNVHAEVLPAASVAVYVTGVVPSPNTSPGLIGLEIVAQLFTVGGVQLTTLSQSPANNVTVMSDGQFDITGPVLSVTVTLKVHVDVFPAASFAV